MRTIKRPLIWILTALLLVSPAAAPAAASVASPAESSGYIVQLNAPLPPDLLSEEDPSLLRAISSKLGLYSVRDEEILHRLTETGLVEYAEPDCVAELFDTDHSAEADPAAWPLEMLKTARGDELGCFGQGVRIAVIDSGCAPHRELADAIRPGWNFLNGTDNVTDNIGHGTFVSGLIAAGDNGFGITGAAPRASIVPLKCFDSGVSTYASTLAAAVFAAVDGFHCQVINMSFGLEKPSKTLETAINYAVDHGVVCVASAGNRGTTAPYYPAALPNVIAVGAVDSEGTVASFSQRNDTLSVMAPGKGIYSTVPSGGYAVNQGTSFSAPLVSALCARLLSADSTLKPQELMRLLTASARDLGEEGYDTAYGHGLAQLDDAMTLLLSDRDCFLSPLLVEDGTVRVSLFNNSDSLLAGQCLFTRFSPSGIMEDIVGQDVVLSPGQAVTVTVPAEAGRLKCTFWPGLYEISPITAYRECEVTT